MVMGTTVFGGCASEPPSFSASDPNKRLGALREAAATNDPETIQPMIEMLESDDPAQRLLAIAALRERTGQTLGYDHTAPEADRHEAVERWKAWYERQHLAAEAAPSGGG